MRKDKNFKSRQAVSLLLAVLLILSCFDGAAFAVTETAAGVFHIAPFAVGVNCTPYLRSKITP